jgi:chromosome segregation ATPase
MDSFSIVEGENVYMNLGEEDSMKGLDGKAKKAFKVLQAFLVDSVPMDADNKRIDLANPVQVQALCQALQSEDLNKKIKSVNTVGTSWNRLVALKKIFVIAATKGNLQIKAVHEDGKREVAAHKFFRESFAKIKEDGLAGLRILFPSAPDEDLKKMEGQLDQVVKTFETRVSGLELRVGKVENSIEIVKTVLDAHGKQLVERKDDIDMLREQAIEHKKETDEHTDEIEMLREQAIELEEEINEHKDEIDVLREQAIELKDEINKHKDEIDMLREQANEQAIEHKKETDEHTDKIEVLREQLRDMEEEHNKQLKENDERHAMQAKLRNKLEAQVERLTAKLRRTGAQLGETRATVMDILQQITQIERKLGKIEAKEEHFTQQLSAVHSKLVSLDQMATKSDEMGSMLTTQLEKLKDLKVQVGANDKVIQELVEQLNEHVKNGDNVNEIAANAHIIALEQKFKDSQDELRLKMINNLKYIRTVGARELEKSHKEIVSLIDTRAAGLSAGSIKRDTEITSLLKVLVDAEATVRRSASTMLRTEVALINEQIHELRTETDDKKAALHALKSSLKLNDTLPIEEEE